jgi:hypothetical protein
MPSQSLTVTPLLTSADDLHRPMSEIGGTMQKKPAMPKEKAKQKMPAKPKAPAGPKKP